MKHKAQREKRRDLLFVTIVIQRRRKKYRSRDDGKESKLCERERKISIVFQSLKISYIEQIFHFDLFFFSLYASLRGGNKWDLFKLRKCCFSFFSTLLQVLPFLIITVVRFDFFHSHSLSLFIFMSEQKLKRTNGAI